MTDDKKELFLQALGNLSNKRKEEREISKFSRPVDKSVNLAKGQLDKDILPVKSSVVEDLTPHKTVVGSTDKIITSEPKQEILSGKQFKNKIDDIKVKSRLKSTMQDAIERGDKELIGKLQTLARKMGKVGKTGLKALPLVGGIASAVMSGDAAAAIPIIGDTESLGQFEKGSLEEKLESGTITPEERDLLMRRMALERLQNN